MVKRIDRRIVDKITAKLTSNCTHKSEADWARIFWEAAFVYGNSDYAEKWAPVDVSASIYMNCPNAPRISEIFCSANGNVYWKPRP